MGEMKALLALVILASIGCAGHRSDVKKAEAIIERFWPSGYAVKGPLTFDEAIALALEEERDVVRGDLVTGTFAFLLTPVIRVGSSKDASLLVLVTPDGKALEYLSFGMNREPIQPPQPTTDSSAVSRG